MKIFVKKGIDWGKPLDITQFPVRNCIKNYSNTEISGKIVISNKVNDIESSEWEIMEEVYDSQIKK